MSSLPPAVRGIRAAFVFLTRVPFGGFPYSRDDWRWSSAHFPLVGAFIGAATGATYLLLAPLGAAADALLAIALQMMITGAFHEDGLADTADALGGAYDRDKLLEILKDSRVGSFGAAALIVSIVGRTLLLAQIHTANWFLLIAVAALARVGPIWLMWSTPYATPAGQSRSRDVTRAGLPQALVATMWGVVAAAVLLVLRPALLQTFGALIAVLALITLLCGWRYRVRLGGITGDFLGATEQLCELGALAVFVWMLR